VLFRSSVRDFVTFLYERRQLLREAVVLARSLKSSNDLALRVAHLEELVITALRLLKDPRSGNAKNPVDSKLEVLEQVFRDDSEKSLFDGPDPSAASQ